MTKSFLPTVLILTLFVVFCATLSLGLNTKKGAVLLYSEKEHIVQVTQNFFAYDDTYVYVVIPHYPPHQNLTKITIYIDNKRIYTAAMENNTLYSYGDTPCTHVYGKTISFIKCSVDFGRHILKIQYSLTVRGEYPLFFVYRNDALHVQDSYVWNVLLPDDLEIPQSDGYMYIKDVFELTKGLYHPKVLTSTNDVVIKDVRPYRASLEANCVVYTSTLLGLLSRKGIPAQPVIGLYRTGDVAHEWLYVLPPYDCFIDAIYGEEICQISTDHIILLKVPLLPPPVSIKDIFEYEISSTCEPLSLVSCGIDVSSNPLQTKIEVIS